MDHQNATELCDVPVEPMLPTPGLRERKKRLRLQRIIDVSHQLFVSKGFQDTTIQDIADEAGIGLGTLYLYAKGKDDLLVLVFREHLLQMTVSAFEIIDPAESVIDQLMTFFSVHIDYHKEDQLLSKTVLKELSFPTNPKRRHDIELIFNTAYEKLALLLKRGLQDGKLYIGTAASSIFGLYYHLLQGFLCGFFGEKEFKKNLRHALDMLLSSAIIEG
jgi:AcrR family transcriptional regulator